MDSNANRSIATLISHWAIVTAVVGWLTAIYLGIRKWFAERTLKNIKRRAEAPYLAPTACTAHQIAEPLSYIDMNANGPMLASFAAKLGSHAIEMRQGFANHGQKVRAVSIVQPSRISLVNVGPTIPEGISPGWIRYIYEHDRKGTAEHFSLSFESFGGFKQIHKYEILHGERSLQRIDPA